MSSRSTTIDRLQNLFGTDWMETFDLFNVPINTFCNNVFSFSFVIMFIYFRTSTNIEKLKRKLKANFPEIFSDGRGFCSKVKAKFALKENTTPIFWPKRQVPFAALANIEKELERLEKLGVIEKNDYSPWASPTGYVKKKSKKRVCVDYSTGLNICFKQIILSHRWKEFSRN